MDCPKKIIIKQTIEHFFFIFPAKIFFINFMIFNIEAEQCEKSTTIIFEHIFGYPSIVYLGWKLRLLKKFSCSYLGEWRKAEAKKLQEKDIWGFRFAFHFIFRLFLEDYKCVFSFNLLEALDMVFADIKFYRGKEIKNTRNNLMIFRNTFCAVAPCNK